jgi:hypothetical protein
MTETTAKKVPDGAEIVTYERTPQGAEVLTVETVGLPATKRCDRCGGQAYVEVEITKERDDLLFCAHHFAQHEQALRTQAVRIFDYRPFLNKQEAALPSH